MPSPIFAASSVDQTIPIQELPSPSVRVGLLLNRFSPETLVMHCTNNQIIHSDLVFNRSIYKVVEEPDVRFAQAGDILLLTPVLRGYHSSRRSKWSRTGVQATSLGTAVSVLARFHSFAR